MIAGVDHHLKRRQLVIELDRIIQRIPRAAVLYLIEFFFAFAEFRLDGLSLRSQGGISDFGNTLFDLCVDSANLDDGAVGGVGRVAQLHRQGKMAAASRRR